MTKRHILGGVVAGAVVTAAAFQFADGFQANAAGKTCLQTYPNPKISGRVVAENDKMVVQRFHFPAGEWEGVHAHPANQLYIMLTDAHWKVRFGDRVSSGFSPAGEVGFYGPVELSEDHESQNMGANDAELIWVTLKEGC